MLKLVRLVALLWLCPVVLNAQQLLPYSFFRYQQLSRALYHPDSAHHTTLRTQRWTGGLKAVNDSLSSRNAVDKPQWGSRKLFNEHLVDIRKNDYAFYLDYLPDVQIGRDLPHGITTWLNTKGVQAGGTVGTKFSFYVSVFENQARFNDYLFRYVDKNRIIPGMMDDKYDYLEEKKTVKDWSYATALLNYTPNNYLSFTLGQDKNFIGDGYRSMILSDLAAAYPFFKVTGTLGQVQYTATYAQFQDPLSKPFSYDNGFRKKWGVFHFLDWNVTKRLSVGFFDAVIWQDADSTGKRGFDVSYLNPIIFLRPVEGMNHSPDNALLGFTARYKLGNRATVYGQLVMDEFTSKEVFAGTGYWGNKLAYQLGLRGFDAFNVRDLNFLFEFNTARPFTYSQRSSLLNYGHYVEALAHPMGANFRELLSIWNYQYQRWTFSAQMNLAQYGLDDGENQGKDINAPYETRQRQHGYKTGGGLSTNFAYLDARVAYVFNPKYNLRIELGGMMRQEKNRLWHDRTTQFTIGLRSTFRNIYQDF